MHTCSLKGLSYSMGSGQGRGGGKEGATAWTVAHLHIWHANDIQCTQIDTIRYDIRCRVHGARYTIFIFAFRFIRCSDAFNCSSCIKICNFILSPRLVTCTRDPQRSPFYADAINNFLAKKRRTRKHANCANIIENFTLTIWECVELNLIIAEI